MRHMIKTDKPKEIIKESDIKQANKYSYKTIIPKEVIDTFPQLKEDAKIVYTIKQISINEFECDITFKAKGIQITNDKELAHTIDKPMTKTIEKKSPSNNEKTDAGNTIDVTHFADIPIKEGKYTVKVTNPSRPKLRITGATIKDEINKNEIGLSVAMKSEDEVRAIIQAIQENENADAKELNDLINSYKSEQYRN